MRNVTWAIAVLLAGCGGGNSATRYFRVVFPSSSGAKPDSCYEAANVAAPMPNTDEQATENFCHVGKKPTSSVSSYAASITRRTSAKPAS